MIKLKNNEYNIVSDIVINTNFELSVMSVITGNNPGEIYVDDAVNPKSVLFKTSECNLVAGYAFNKDFNVFIKDILSFWDMLICDSAEWEQQLINIHPNKYLRKVHKRFLRHNKISKVNIQNFEYLLQPERITSELLEMKHLKNLDKVKEWIDENWFSTTNFLDKGIGFCIKDEYRIISWSLMDCYHSEKAEIGIFTDEEHKGKGFGTLTAAATVKACFEMNINQIGWHCIDTNKGSCRIAKKIGFEEVLLYSLYTPYPPIENNNDLNSSEWEEWAQYYNSICFDQDEYIWLAAECWAKAENIDKTINICKSITESLGKSDELFAYFKNNAAFSKFQSNPKWKSLLQVIR